MTTAYTSLLGLALPVTGELSGTWGDTVNDSITSLLDSAVAGTTTISSDADVTLTTTTGASNTSRQAILLWTAGGTVTRNITAPAQSKIYTVINKSSSTQSIVLRGAGPTTGVTIVQGESAVCAWNGSDFIKISNTSGAGVFTTLSVSGAVTLSGGTANGVAYLNGSKVLTTGSALTFDGTNLGLSNSAVATLVKIDGSGRYKQFETYSSGTRQFYIGWDNTSQVANITNDNNYPILFSITGSEQMRLTSTGLGIGTSSPAYKLDVSKAAAGDVARFTNGGASNKSLFVYTDATYAAIATGVGASGNGIAFDAVNNKVLFTTASTNQMFLDSSGNLGLGVTPSAWRTAGGEKAIQIGTALTAYSNSGGDVYWNKNWFLNSSSQSIYLNNGFAQSYGMVSGEHRWYTAPSGTAGNAITFTQAMTLDASGNLGIGTTSPAALKRLHVANVAAGSGMRVSGPTSDNNWAGGIEFYSDNATTTTSNILVSSGGMQFGYGGSERMRIDSSGNVGIGTTTPNKTGFTSPVLSITNGTSGIVELIGNQTADATIGQVAFYNTSSSVRIAQILGLRSGANNSGAITFQTNNAGTLGEAARIDSSGNVGIGTSSPAVTLSVAGTIGVFGGSLNGSIGSPQLYRPASDTLAIATGAVERMRIDSSGNLGIAQTDPTNNGVSGYNNLVIGNSSSSTCGLTFKTISSGTPYPGIAWSRGAGSGVNGKVYYDQSTDRLYCQAGGSGGVYLAGGGTSWTSASDERVKDIIEPIENATQKLANWRTVIGKYKSDTDGVRRSFLIAQDVLTTFPEAVNTDKAEEYGLNYQDLIPLLVASIQELKAEFDAYKALHP